MKTLDPELYKECNLTTCDNCSGLTLQKSKICLQCKYVSTIKELQCTDITNIFDFILTDNI